MKTLNFVLIGAGTVGRGVMDIYLREKEKIFSATGIKLNCKGVCDLSFKRKKPAYLKGVKTYIDYKKAVSQKGVDTVIELVGGVTVAKDIAVYALANKKNFVTANKALISTYGPLLYELAEKNKTDILFEGAVAGSIPVINTLRKYLFSNTITEIYGIINGTSNYILTQMTKHKLSFAKALSDAQKKGFAESDPTFDINGLDAAHKLTVLAQLLYNANITISDVYYEGIEDISDIDIEIAEKLGYGIKLLAVCVNNGKTVQLRVHPALIPKNCTLMAVSDEYNAIYLKGDKVGTQMYYGKGAGSLPTGTAVIADTVSTGVGGLKQKFDLKNDKIKVQPAADLKTNYYLRLNALDKPGVLSKVAGVLGANGISVSSCIQIDTAKKHVPLIIMTHLSTEKNMRKAIDEINRLNVIAPPAHLIRVEEGAGS